MSFIMDPWNTAGLSAENAASTGAIRSRPRALGLICMDAQMRWMLHTSEPLQQSLENRIVLQLCFPIRVPLHNLMPFNWDKQS